MGITNRAGDLKEAGSHSFTMSPSRWIEETGAIGLVSKNGVNGGTYAQYDIAVKFASWVSVEFELYLVKEFRMVYANEADVLNVALFGFTAKEWRDAHADL